jgi:acetyl esterase/lipase
MARLDSGSNVPQRPGAEAHQRSWSRSSGFGGTTKGVPPPPLPDHKQGQPVDVGTTAPFPTATASAPQETPNLELEAHRQTVRLTATNGEELVIQDQIQLYAQNDQLTHPLVSSAMSYLGGLPPLLFIISDKEVLRDEGVYT